MEVKEPLFSSKSQCMDLLRVWLLLYILEVNLISDPLLLRGYSLNVLN